MYTNYSSLRAYPGGGGGGVCSNEPTTREVLHATEQQASRPLPALLGISISRRHSPVAPAPSPRVPASSGSIVPRVRWVRYTRIHRRSCTRISSPPRRGVSAKYDDPLDPSTGLSPSRSAAVISSFDLPETRDRRASSAIVLLERHNSSIVPYLGDLADDEDDERATPVASASPHKKKTKLSSDGQDPLLPRRHDNDTVNTSENDYSIMMASPNAPLGDVAAASGSGSRNRPWYVRFRVFEFLVSLIMCGMAGAFALMKTHMRVIPRVEVVISANLTVYARDPTIDQKKLAEQVPMSALLAAATGIPIVVNLFMNFVLPKFKRIRIIPHDTRDFLLSLCQAVGISQVITHFIKNMAGRFRPSFYDMCKWDYSKVWDGVTNLCQDEKTELEGRRSFPSGHASYAFATLFLLTLYLLGRSRINCENRDETLLRGSRKTFKLFLCFAPTLLAAWVAVTRSVDNWHHYSDILAGSIIGVLAASIGYSYNYGSIFNWEAAGVPYEEAHIRRKKRDRDLAEASLTLLHSSADMHGEPTSHSGASYTTAKTAPASRKNDISIHIQ